MALSAAASRIREWREHPDVFVREVFGVEPDAWQLDVLQAFPTTPRTAMCACKGPGKTSTLAWIAWNFLLTRLHPKIAATSITGDNLSDGLWTEMAKWQARSDLLQTAFQWTRTRIFAKDHPETWWMSARTWPRSGSKDQQADTLAGLHADNLLFLIDEAGGIPDAVLAAGEAGLANTVGGNEAHIVIAGNPTHLEGPLYRAATSERHLWKVVEITADPNDPNRTPRVSAQWASEQIEKWGRDNPWVLVNVFGKFPPASINALIGPDEVRAAMKRTVTEAMIQGLPMILGVDVAREGLDASVIYKRKGRSAAPPIVMRNVDGIQGAGRTSQEWETSKADACFVDNTGGFGASWIDQLRVLGRTPTPVHFAGKPTNERYVNKRSEMLFEAAQWVKDGGCLPDDSLLLGEMVASEYFFKGDKIAVIEKDQVKAKIGRSPDHFDALALTFAYPVAPRDAHGNRPGATVPMQSQTYDPYARL
ncbi:MAG TPA: hypothetical protein VFN69_04325 [Rudaea sp.]|nr:hypothetical protein [Rudaea sp.]